MWNSHGETSKNGNLAASHVVKKYQGRYRGHELSNIDEPAQNQRGFLALSKSGKERGCVVYKGVDAFITFSIFTAIG